MSSQKFTPGPWKWTRQYDNSRGQATWTLMGAVGTYGILSCDAEENSPQGLGTEGAANAELIAAAPELLEALRRTLDYAKDKNHVCYAEESCGRCDSIEQANAAIAKAEGRA